MLTIKSSASSPTSHHFFAAKVQSSSALLLDIPAGAVSAGALTVPTVQAKSQDSNNFVNPRGLCFFHTGIKVGVDAALNCHCRSQIRLDLGLVC